MRKVLITKEHKDVGDTIVIPFTQADKFVQALKDNHFEEVRLEVGEEGLTHNKLFIYIPRILRDGGSLRLVGLKKDDQAKVTKIITGLGLRNEVDKDQETLAFTKPAPEN